MNANCSMPCLALYSEKGAKLRDFINWVFKEMVKPGICLRCGEPFLSPYPELVAPELVIHSGDSYSIEIASDLFCAYCNAKVMAVERRGSSVYRSPIRKFFEE